ncbi:DUF1707 domain-containing protein [Rhodococcus sp. NPDC059234]|uniref:DUF1707 SHOCT-like domain-containing protein n=1 Tax=Rhodococcus sp. NPDC059234 TaxID=3346781 RepID=UPI00366FF1F9
MASRYPPGTRARDADRDAVRALLDAARADGQLSEPEHGARTGLCAEARTLADLSVLVGDLQQPLDAPRAPVPPAPTPRHRFWVGVAAAAAAAAAVGAFLFVSHDDADAAPAAAPDTAVDLDALPPLVKPTPSLVTREGVEQFIADYRAEFGDTVVDDLDLFPAHAGVNRAVPREPNRRVEYLYRGGFDPRSDPTTRKLDTPTFDLATIDTAILERLLAGAVASTNVPGGAVTGISVEADEGAPAVRISVGNEFSESGYLEVTPAGKPLEVHPFGG